MDFVSRIKKFMDSQKIASSHFADACGIPRPTISQILTGRNKKISDELIGKIHAAFPQLSIMWLMFGEGEMVTDSNIKISEPQKASELSFGDTHSIDNEDYSEVDYTLPLNTEKSSENFHTLFEHPSTPKNSQNTQNATLGDTLAQTINEKTESPKRITSIVVFYGDNTFQTFNPS